MKFKSWPTLILASWVVISIQPSPSLAWEIDQSQIAITAPPSKGSAAFKRDYQILKDYQNTRTEDECSAANLQSYASALVFFGPKTGVLTAEEFKGVSEFSEKLVKAVSSACEPFKLQYLRQRPYDVDRAIVPCVRLPGGQKSYPSSHAGMGVVLAKYLSAVFPTKKKAIMEQGQRIGDYRVLGGVHHQSDIEAGREIGKQLIKLLNADVEFRADFEKIKKYKE